MQAGLYGIPELHTGRGHGTVPDYLHRCLSPVRAGLPELQQMSDNYRRHRPNGIGATANDLGNNHARVLVDALSTPELVHILTKWHIRDPRGMPYSNGVPRNQLLDLVVQHDEALAEVVRLVTPLKGDRGVISTNADKKAKTIRIRSDRAASAAYRSILNDYMNIHNAQSTQMEVRIPSRERSSSVPITERRNADETERSAMSLDLYSARRSDPASYRNREPADRQSNSAREGKEGSCADTSCSSLSDSRRRYHKLKKMLSETRRQREECVMELAKKGLLGLALDSDMYKPVYRGQDTSTETVKRNMDATGAFHLNRYSKDLPGVKLDAIRTTPSLIPPQMRTLCL